MGKLEKDIKKKVEKKREEISIHSRFPLIFALISRSREAQMTIMASSISYYLLLAIFPFVILFSSIISISGLLTKLDADSLIYLQEILPSPVYDFLSGFMHNTMGEASIPILSVSSVMALWAASKGMGVLLRGIRGLYDRQPRHLPFVWRILGLFFTIFLCISIILSLVLLAFGDVLMTQIRIWTNMELFTGRWLTVGRFIGSYLFLFFFFLILYRISGMKKTNFRKCTPGASLASLSWLLFSIIFSTYVTNFSSGRFSLFYGSVAGIIVLILWLYFCCFSLLCGALFNIILVEKRENRLIASKQPESESKDKTP